MGDAAGGIKYRRVVPVAKRIMISGKRNRDQRGQVEQDDT